MSLTCFKANDIRGRLGIDFDVGIAYRIGRGFAQALKAKHVVLGRDCRASSTDIADSVSKALMAEGVEVLDLGLCGTEEMYFATEYFSADGGICITASHNPMDWNGMKMVRAGAAPLDATTGLVQIRALAETNDFGPQLEGSIRPISAESRAAYVSKVLSFVDIAALKPLTIVVNAGNGAAGPSFDAIASELAAREAPLKFHRMHHDPDGSFPNGIPNPLLEKNQPETAHAVRAAGADFGVAWDGDFDRCFFFDHEGSFIAGEYVVGLLAETFLAKQPGARIIHDPRVIWNTLDVIEVSGGQAVQARTGHAFIKQAMRDTDAIYGGEMSAHHYFRDFAYCDSGMIPWLLIAELVSRQGSLRNIVAARQASFPSSGEINFTLDDPQAAVAKVRAEFTSKAVGLDETDGLSFDLGTWRFNLRCSNTEPLVRLNVEAKGDANLVSGGVASVRSILIG